MYQVDYNKLKDICGFKNTASANTAFLAAHKKLLAGATTGDADTGGDNDETPKATPKRKRANALSGDDATPTAKKRGRPSKKAKVTENAEDDEEEKKVKSDNDELDPETMGEAAPNIEDEAVDELLKGAKVKAEEDEAVDEA